MDVCTSMHIEGSGMSGDGYLSTEDGGEIAMIEHSGSSGLKWPGSDQECPSIGCASGGLSGTRPQPQRRRGQQPDLQQLQYLFLILTSPVRSWTSTGLDRQIVGWPINQVFVSVIDVYVRLSSETVCMVLSQTDNPWQRLRNSKSRLPVTPFRRAKRSKRRQRNKLSMSVSRNLQRHSKSRHFSPSDMFEMTPEKSLRKVPPAVLKGHRLTQDFLAIRSRHSFLKLVGIPYFPKYELSPSLSHPPINPAGYDPVPWRPSSSGLSAWMRFGRSFGIWRRWTVRCVAELAVVSGLSFYPSVDNDSDVFLLPRFCGGAG